MRTAAGAVLLSLMSTVAAVAQKAPDPATADVRGTSHRIIDVAPGSQVVVHLNRPFSSVSVGDPEIVDVLPRSDRVFVVLGRKVGSADIVVFSDANDIYKLTAVVGAQRPPSRIMSHGKKDLQQYTAYECNPVCVRVKDEFEGPAARAPIIIEGGSANVNLTLPTNGGAAAPR